MELACEHGYKHTLLDSARTNTADWYLVGGCFDPVWPSRRTKPGVSAFWGFLPTWGFDQRWRACNNFLKYAEGIREITRAGNNILKYAESIRSVTWKPPQRRSAVEFCGCLFLEQTTEGKTIMEEGEGTEEVYNSFICLKAKR